MLKRLGSRTVVFQTPPVIVGHANAVGKKEGEGPLADSFDYINDDAFFGERTWEKAESRMQKEALTRALDKSGLAPSEIDYIFAGDLLNQCVGTAFCIRDTDIPFFGLYGACSTMGESLSLAALLIDGGFASNAAALTSSHFSGAERQYRMPNQYGGQRTPTAQWTVTGAGAVILSREGSGPCVRAAAVGKVVDLGIKDAANMGAAMAPAAYDTLTAFFSDTGTRPADYDLIVTGDLGKLGKDIIIDFFRHDGVDISPNYNDCGVMIFDLKKQDMHAGGSGCGCSASVLTGYILNGMRAGKWNNVLFAPTGALMSPTVTQQGESIPGICHLLHISNNREG